MQAVQRHPAASLLAPAGQAREPLRSKPAAQVVQGNAGDDSPLPWIERWTERFCERLVAWGDGATHRRLGSWTRY